MPVLLMIEYEKKEKYRHIDGKKIFEALRPEKTVD